MNRPGIAYPVLLKSRVRLLEKGCDPNILIPDVEISLEGD